jgi:excisionase family DNA binding protein
MIMIDKRQEWQNLEREFKRTVDGQGRHIDAGIMETVVAFNAAGCHTTASCEGHLDHGAAYPWLDVSSTQADDVADKIAMLLYEGKREDPETQRLMQEHRRLLLQAEYELVQHLNAFYQRQPFDYDCHLSIVRFSNGKPRLQSYGADTQEFRDPSERAIKLAAYQQEMQRFATFLRDRFFGTTCLPAKEEYTTHEASHVLGMEMQAVTRNISRGNLTATKRGRDYIIRAEELERFKQTPRQAGRPSRARAAIPT